MRAIAALALVTGCGFQVNGSAVPEDARPDAPDAIDAPDAPDDVPPDSAPTCLDRWLDGTIRFQPPVPLTSVSSGSYDRDPYVTRDELTLYTSTGRGGTGADIYMATRAAATDDFGTPVRNGSASTDQSDTKLSIVRDGQTAFIGSARPNGNNNIDVWEATHTNGTFGGFTQMHLGAVNSGGNEHDPFISADGLHLYLAPDTGGTQRIVVASRASTSANFNAPVRIDALYSGAGDADPTLSDDERVIVFASHRPDPAHAAGNLWFATRASAAGTFSAPIAVPDLDTDLDEGDPHLSVDGCRLYFARYVQGTDWDLFVAHATTP